ncbi:Hpt domain-containing protein [Curvibacter sp. APW13]|uniref:response regulator n=1 Tax=Curvibacter sp. APW13 TaxID=3077236 RepID=UPI0028DFB3E4|nr:Hpt domain-containing protein [Curvibacter sp. APW13]MDT8992478.1 Hpt domain-containing protein [Curvibacter sp. APW13]
MSADLAALMAELLAEFLDELPARCHELEESILALESGQEGAFDELYRQVHSLKGTGGGVGLPVITTICHQFESFLSEVRVCFDHKATNTALAYVDLLRRTIGADGRTDAAVAATEQALEAMRLLRLSGRTSVLIAEPSQTLRRVYQDELAGPQTKLHLIGNGMQALERLLHEPFDLLILSRELPALNGLAVVAALREARCSNSNIPVVLVSSNTAPVGAHLNIQTLAKRDQHLLGQLQAAISRIQNARAAR